MLTDSLVCHLLEAGCFALSHQDQGRGRPKMKHADEPVMLAWGDDAWTIHQMYEKRRIVEVHSSQCVRGYGTAVSKGEGIYNY